MKKKFQRKALSLDCEEENVLANSIYSEIGPDGLKFLKDNIRVSKEGLMKISGDANHFQPICMEQIQIINKHLGRGAAGSVQEGIYKPLNIRVAIKSINAYDKEKRHQLMNDIKILLQNKIDAENSGYYCQFLVSLFGAFYDDGSVKIVLELMDAGSVGDILRIYKAAEVQAPIIEENALSGLSYLHVISHQIHRDIKPDNVLLSKNGYVKLTDFGISRDLEQSAFCTTVIGTYTYMSPERIEGRKYNHLSDIWSFGIMLYELATGKYPYTNTKTYIEMLHLVVNEPSPQLPENIPFSKHFRDFLNLCLQKIPSLRPSAAELLSHPWILQNFASGPTISQWLTKVKENILPVAQKNQTNNQRQQVHNTLQSNEPKVEVKQPSRIIPNQNKYLEIMDHNREQANQNESQDFTLSQHSLRLTKDKDGIINSIQFS